MGKLIKKAVKGIFTVTGVVSLTWFGAVLAEVIVLDGIQKQLPEGTKVRLRAPLPGKSYGEVTGGTDTVIRYVDENNKEI